MTVQVFWKKFNIREAVNYLVSAWNQITNAPVHHAWMPLLPHLAKSQDSRQQQEDLLLETVQSVQSIPAPGFNSVNEDQINELLGALRICWENKIRFSKKRPHKLCNNRRSQQLVICLCS
ncbi:hypothetical protein Hamer_G023065 [Homarus americanus]|uniref:Uncharacterized protein n=1 Tax=Homarus americanus TaxID=6706 RepID=A0A8J5JA61_HOMAM|nr:hypothetical protein Hamer_G023065 [Homarus americanus]